MNQKIYVTGATGFVGKNLVNYLSKFNMPSEILSRSELLNDLDQNCEVLVHLAGKAHDLKKTSNVDDYYTINYELTRKLYDAFLESNAKKFIFISSVKAVADIVDEELTEAHIPNPITDYGKSKLMAEQYILSQPLPNGKSYYILRPCMIHGPGNKGNLNLLYKFVQKGIPYPLACFENKRSFLGIDNLCFIIANLINKEAPSGVYNVADDESLSTNVVIKVLANSMGKKATLWSIPIIIMRSIAKIGDLIKLPLNTERLNKLTENYVVSNHKIKDVLKIELPLTTISGLAITAKSFKI